MFEKRHMLLFATAIILPLLEEINKSMDLNSEVYTYQSILPALDITLLFIAFCMVNILIESVIIKFNTKNKGTKIVVTQLMADLLLIYIYVYTGFWRMPETSKYQPGGAEWIFFGKLIILSVLFISMQGTIRTYMEKKNVELLNAELLNENLMVRYNALRQQINLHFLNNSLTTLISLVRLNDKNTEKYIISLANIYRQLISKHDTKTIPLHEELDILNAYLFLMRVCYEEAIRIQINLQEKSLNRHIPTFTLQVLAENCIKHNIISLENPLMINIYQSDMDSICIENTYQPKMNTLDSTGIGLINIRNRYKLLDIEEGLYITQDNEKFSVTVKLI